MPRFPANRKVVLSVQVYPLISRLRIDPPHKIWETGPIAAQKTVSFYLCIPFIALALCTGAFGQDVTVSKELSRSREVTKSESVGRRAEERQIKVYSKNPLIKAQFDAYSRDLRAQFRYMLGLYKSDDWRVHYRVYLYGTGDDVHSGSDIITGAEMNAANQFSISIKVKIHDRFEEETYRYALMKMLLLEQMLEAYLDEPKSFSNVNLTPPDWLIHGFNYNLRHKQLGRPSYFFSGFLKSGQLMSVEEIMKPDRARGLNPLSLELFRASSAVLVGALCDQKDGGESIRGMLQDMGQRQDYEPLSMIRKHFPGFRETGQGIDKWWALQLATLAQQQSFEFYSAQQTEKYLTQALEVSFNAVEVPSAKVRKVNPSKTESLIDRLKEKVSRDEDTGMPSFNGTIANYREFMNRKGADMVIAHRQASLYTLKIRSFPLYHDVIDRYTEVCNNLLKGDTEDLDKELNELSDIRKQILASLEKTRDYLNYYEATRSPERSDAFDSYLEFKDSMKMGSLPKRTDPISIYMDKIEQNIPFHND